ncbi:enzymatic polyprotein; endonuclease; Reverse transcriptase, putative [Rhizophagus clarus]|uniref:Enzymatic polyprotein endonuclease Reverse transcriptase, putative n=1 Tax=Rhizophagus clarus TaxID=94130 RepID=A0A8H3MD29_9GLOM|nr:enzymatic polyprotein; endonuclease; Reverse transcriptase, putative [Rhizophagus clarus]
MESIPIPISDAYPLPRIDELLERYQTAKWFTSMDLASGFHQVEMEETDKEKTAFICSESLYEFNVMPFGLRNAPGTFQRMMDKILREYIGHEIGNDGLKPNLKKIEAINRIKEPRTVTENINREPILAHPDFSKEFILITDASADGLGAILSQKNDEDKEVVIACASKSTNSNKRNYPITDLECLAIIWAVRHFHKFLINNKFKIITDYATLKSLMKDKELKGRRARWMMELQQYNFEIIHRSEKLNTNADALSRLKFRND